MDGAAAVQKHLGVRERTADAGGDRSAGCGGGSVGCVACADVELYAVSDAACGGGSVVGGVAAGCGVGGDGGGAGVCGRADGAVVANAEFRSGCVGRTIQ